MEVLQLVIMAISDTVPIGFINSVICRGAPSSTSFSPERRKVKAFFETCDEMTVRIEAGTDCRGR